MSYPRRCSRTACGRKAKHTLTYVYADQTAVLGPLSHVVEPHAYDLCDEHSERLVGPRGWEVVRLTPAEETGPSTDDLLALADAVREAGRPAPQPQQVSHGGPAGVGAREVTRRGHLRVLTTD